MTIKDSWEENMKIKKLLPAVLAALLSLTVIISPLSIHADEDDPKPTSIRRLNYSKKTLRVGQKFELEAYARPSDYDDDPVSYTHLTLPTIRLV